MKSPLPARPFEAVSIVIAAINETTSLRKTIEILARTCQPADIREIIIVVSKQKSTPECLETTRDLCKNAQLPTRILEQTRPFAGGAYQDAFEVATGSHLIMMASDLETDPEDAHKLIAEAKAHSDAVICTSRWIEGSHFGEGYQPVKFVANYIFQKLMQLLYGKVVTDWTFGYRLFPIGVVKSIAWEELRHPFFLETILKPLSAGIPAREIPTSWEPREEGESQNPFWRNFLYFKIALKTRFADKKSLWREDVRPSASA